MNKKNLVSLDPICEDVWDYKQESQDTLVSCDGCPAFSSDCSSGPVIFTCNGFKVGGHSACELRMFCLLKRVEENKPSTLFGAPKWCIKLPENKPAETLDKTFEE